GWRGRPASHAGSARARSRLAADMSGRTWSRIGLLLAFAPFLIFCLMVELIPTFALLVGSIGGVEKHSFEWIGKVFTNATFHRSILNSLLLGVHTPLPVSV